MTTFVVGHIDWSENELRLEQIEALDWRAAVASHSKYPWFGEPQDDPIANDTIEPDAFKQQCFDCDCMMSWIEVKP